MVLPVEKIKLIEDTWAIAVKVDGVVDTFYGRLFTLKPEYKTTLFARTSIQAQSKMLASMLDTAVKNLRNPDVLVPVLTDLGVRHCRYGVRPEHYGAVGEALLWTLEHYLKDKFTPAVKAAWTELYGIVTAVMTAPCETAEGKQMLAEYERRNGAKPSAKKASASSYSSSVQTIAVVVAVVAGLGYFWMSSQPSS